MRLWLLRATALIAMLGVAGYLLRQPARPGWQGAMTSAGPIHVVTTILPIYALTRSIAGTDGIVRNLLRPGVDIHDVALTPQDIALCTQADLVLVNGAGLDDFIVEALRRARVPDSKIVSVSDGLPRAGDGPDGAADEHGHDHSHGGESHGTDPHYWLNPSYARSYVRRIADEIAARVPNPEAVRSRSAALDGRIAELDAVFDKALVPLRGQGVIAHHAAYAHFAQRYRVRIAGTWQSTPGREPTPQEVAALLRTAQSADAVAIMVEPQLSSRSIDLLTRDTGLALVRFDPMETAADLDSVDYVTTMQRNLRALQEALR